LILEARPIELQEPSSLRDTQLCVTRFRPGIHVYGRLDVTFASYRWSVRIAQFTALRLTRANRRSVTKSSATVKVGTFTVANLYMQASPPDFLYSSSPRPSSNIFFRQRFHTIPLPTSFHSTSPTTFHNIPSALITLVILYAIAVHSDIHRQRHRQYDFRMHVSSGDQRCERPSVVEECSVLRSLAKIVHGLER